MGRGGADREFGVYPANTTLGWSIIRRVSFDKGESKVAAGVWRRVNDSTGNHIGYQMVGAAGRVDRDLPSRPQPVSITAEQSEKNAGAAFVLGQSRTVGMSEERRMERVARKLDPEDAMERLQMKIAVFRHVGSAKGDILRVWPRGAAEPLGAAV